MPTEAEIVDHLVAKFSPQVILLGGSRADGEATIYSDWDLYLIGAYPLRKTFPELFKAAHLDVEVRPPIDIPDNILKIFYGPVSSLKVLLDSTDQLGMRVVEQTRLAYENGPPPKTLEAMESDRSNMARMLAKITSHAQDAEACFMNLGFFHRLAIQHWFDKQQRWSLPPYKALAIIRREEPKFAALLATVASGQPIENKLEACNEVQLLIWGT